MNSKLAIRPNLEYITANTSNLPRLLTLLVQNEIFEQEEKEDVDSKSTPYERVSHLYTLIQKKDPEEFEVILDCLKRSGSAHVASKLIGNTLGRGIYKRAPLLSSATRSTSASKTDFDDLTERYVNDNAPKIITLEGDQKRYENFNVVMGEISLQLEYLSLMYVFATPKQLLKTFEFCACLTHIILHNVNISGMFSRKVETEKLVIFDYKDDDDMNDIKYMETDDRVQFFQQLLFFVPKDKINNLEHMNIKITVCIADFDYILISHGPERYRNPFKEFDQEKESILVVEDAFAEINSQQSENSQEVINYFLNDMAVNLKKFDNMVSNNGEFITNMTLHHITLSKDTLLSYLRKCPSLKVLRLEICSLQGNFSCDERVFLKDFQDFNLDIREEHLGNNCRLISEYFTGIMPGILFFNKTNSSWDLDEFWKQNVNVRIKINSHIMMDIKTVQNSTKIALNNTNELVTNDILNGIPENINRVYFNTVELPKSFAVLFSKTSLTHFVLRYVLLPNIAEFIRDCVNLKVLVIFDANTEPIFFSRDLDKLKGLRKISLNNATVKFPIDDRKWQSLEELHLFHCYCSNAPHKIHNNFPNLKSFTFDSRNFCDPILLKSLLQLKNSIKFISIWRFCFTGDYADEVKTFIQKYHGCPVDVAKRHFSLEKVTANAVEPVVQGGEHGWKITFVDEYSGPEWGSQEYQHFNFNQFFLL